MTTATAPEKGAPPAAARTDVDAVARREEPALTPFEVIESVVSSGDLSKMTPEQRVAFYWRTCESLRLNPMTRPFDFIAGDGGKIVMYAKRDATDQLRAKHHVSIDTLERKVDADVATVEARGAIIDPLAPSGIRRDSALGSVAVKGLAGQALSNAIMKAETKAKRRLTLSLVGLGFLDESEIEGLGQAGIVDPETGEISPTTEPQTLLERVQAQRAAMEGTPETAAGTSDDAQGQEVEGESRELDASAAAATSAADAEGWTRAELTDRLHAAGIPLAAAVEAAARLWPERDPAVELTPTQRVELFETLQQAVAEAAANGGAL